MRLHAKGALLCLLLCLGATRAALAQGQQKDKQGSSSQAYRASRETSDLQPKAIKSRLLTLEEGLAILGVALDFRHHGNLPSDCSHFVHELYGRAGFPYEYASSSDLYAGIDEFRRVTWPQPGDLAVWRGHAGIVVNPAQHSFFSALSTGHGVDSYDSPYWKQRGRPRFYRYVQVARGGVLSTATRTASLKPAALGHAEPRQTPGEDSVADRPEPKGLEESSGQGGSSTKLAEKQPMDTPTPPVPVVNSVRPKPDEVAKAFLETCNDWGDSLRERDLFKAAQPVIVFDHFEVRKVHITGNQGWAEVQIDQLVSLTGSKAEVHKRLERQRWPLTRRDNQSWELTPSHNTLYLPQHVAERVLAGELARLTEDGSDTASPTQEKAELARVLDVLLGK